jgi:hypothetical protein
MNLTAIAGSSCRPAGCDNSKDNGGVITSHRCTTVVMNTLQLNAITVQISVSVLILQGLKGRVLLDYCHDKWLL